MAKETKAQRDTRVGMLLAEYKNRNEELNKLQTIVKGLKAQVEEIPNGTYGDWIRSTGTPREMLDQSAVRADFAARGVPVPTFMTKPPIVVSPRVG